jgi:hypothetical protein
MTYKEMLRITWETIKEVTNAPLSREPMSWKEAFRLFRRSILLGLWRCVFGFSMFIVFFLLAMTIFRVWTEITHLSK